MSLRLKVTPRAGEPLIQPVIRAGRRLSTAEPLVRLRERCARERTRLPEHLSLLETQPHYVVDRAKALLDLAQ